MDKTLEDGTPVFRMSDTLLSGSPQVYLPVFLELIPLSNDGTYYAYSVKLSIPLVASGQAVKSFSANLDYGDGSTAFNSISYNSFQTVEVELFFPTKYYKAGNYTVRITNYTIMISSSSDPWNPGTEEAGTVSTMWSVSVPD